MFLSVRVVFAMKSLMCEVNAMFAFFFKTCKIFSVVNVNMAVRKLLISFTFQTHFFGDETFNLSKRHQLKK